MTQVLVRYFAAARAAAGVDEETITIPSPSSVQDVIASIADTHGAALAMVLMRCSFLLNEVIVHDLNSAVTSGDAVDVLPPFAGG